MGTLKAKISDTITLREVKGTKTYLKETVFEQYEIENVVRQMMKNNEIGLTKIFETELTSYGVGSTVVYVIANGLRHDVPGTQAAFVEIFYEYEKGVDDTKAIIRIYK